MNIIKSLLKTNSQQLSVNKSLQELSKKPKKMSKEILLVIATLMAGCNCDTYWLDSFEEGRCEESSTEDQDSLDENLLGNNLEENTEIPEFEVIQSVGHACSDLDDNAISTNFFSKEFKDSCETETRCESGRDFCESFSCEVQKDTFKICISEQTELQGISTNAGSYFNISCSVSSITQAPYCELRMGEDLELVQEYSYQCESGYEDTLEARYVRFFTKDIESNKTICDDETGKCLTTTNYLRISSTLPDDLNDSCSTTKYGHCHAQDVTVTLEEKADGQKTYCLEATINN